MHFTTKMYIYKSIVTIITVITIIINIVIFFNKIKKLCSDFKEFTDQCKP